MSKKIKQNFSKRGTLMMFVLSSIASATTIAPGIWGNVLVVVIAIILAITLITNDECMNIRKRSFYIIFPIYLLLIFGALLRFFTIAPHEGANIGPLHIVMPVATVFVSFICLFIIPTNFNKVFIFWFISRISALGIIIGLPSLVIGEYSLLWIEIDPYVYIQPFRRFDINIWALNSIWMDANDMGEMALFGIFASMYELSNGEKTIFSNTFLFINSIGLYLANSRAAIVAAVIGLAIYAAYVYLNKSTVRVLALGIFATSIFVVFYVISVPPNQPTILHIPVRRAVWDAVMQAIADSPILGYTNENISSILGHYLGSGSGPLSGYLKVYLLTGIIGGTLYLLFHINLFYDNLGKNSDGIIYSLIVAISLVQVFANIPIFGVNDTSVLMSIIYGFWIADG